VSRRPSPLRSPSSIVGSILGAALALAGAGIAATGSPSSSARVIATTAIDLPLALVVPDPALHPGARNTSVTKGQLCSADYKTSDVRPPTSYTNRLKQLELGDGGTIVGPSGKTYTVTGEHLPGAIADYELDHLISLELGGNPEDPANLWMEPWERKGAHLAAPGQGAESKDVVEGRLHRAVCGLGSLTLSKAQDEIASDWMTAR
jgi:hypothetical protein